jgi:hypothetical protein
MADLNALIAQGVQFKAPPDPFAQYAQMQQLQQGEQANQLNQMKMQEYQRGMAETNALRQLDPSSPTYLKEVMKISPEKGYAFSKLQQEAAAAKLTQQKTLVDVAKQKREFVQQAQRDTSRNPSDANVTAFKEDLMASDLFTDAEKAQMGAGADRILAMPVNERQAFMASQGATAGDLSSAESARLGRLTTERGQDIAAGTAKAGQESVAATARAGQESVAATARAGQGVTMRGQNLLDTREKENIAIRQEDQRRKGDPAFVQQMAQANATGQAIAKDYALAQQVLPKVLDTAQQTLSQIDSLIGKRDDKGALVKGEAPHPGFQDVVGATWRPGLRFVPGTDAADFQSKLDQVKGGAFLQAYETLKGGGSITNIEGEKGTSALNRMSTAQSEKEFVTAAREFQSVVRKAVERAKTRVGGGTTVVDFGSLK